MKPRKILSAIAISFMVLPLSAISSSAEIKRITIEDDNGNKRTITRIECKTGGGIGYTNSLPGTTDTVDQAIGLCGEGNYLIVRESPKEDMNMKKNMNTKGIMASQLSN